MKNTLIIIFFFFGNLLQCQQLEGYVFNEDKEPLSSVSVFLNGSFIAKTNERGFFPIHSYQNKNENRDSLEFRYKKYIERISLSDFIKSKNTFIIRDYYDIETVEINLKDYKLYEYHYGLKKETNSRFIPTPLFEMALRFKNEHNKKGIIDNVVLFLHKTERDIDLVPLEISFYAVDTLTGMPAEKLNKNPIIYYRKNKSRAKVNVKVGSHKIPFPKEGVFVAIKWLPDHSSSKNVGPSVRLTVYTSERLTYQRYDNNSWHLKGGQNSRSEKFVNMMVGIDVYIRKQKNNE